MIALALLLAAQDAPPVEAPPCLTDMEPLTGEVRMVETRRPGSRNLTFPFLVLDKARCVQVGKTGSFGRWVQLGLDQYEIRTLVPGSTISIKAHYAAPASAMHVGDIIALDAEIVGGGPLPPAAPPPPPPAPPPGQ